MFDFIRKHARKIISVVIITLLSLSLWQLAAASWIQGKAVVAQHLLMISWQQTLKEKDSRKPSQYKPWPWADTWPVAKLIAPNNDIKQIILAGDSGSSLAFAPGHSFASAAPNTIGTSVISGHRDTHFNFLKDLKINEILYVQTISSTIAYQINHIQIVDSQTFKLPVVSNKKNLVLVTCYPFNAFSNEGSLRYLVYASEVMNHDNFN